jgi:glycine/D-amino acid oxidase-like deaminating enzyme
VHYRLAGLRVLETYAPGLLAATRGERVFCDAYNESRLPEVVKDADRPGLFVMAGSSGSGFRYGPYLAQAAVQDMAFELNSDERKANAY